ncbi:hypothetical protein COO60DRAFT_1537760 [Scenedesmus sp. NREL 46B-D3]|nr:hypothetical protein COO60DRAFT_1537760 [Scenedesmus sp. NREL 46B-D3]
MVDSTGCWQQLPLSLLASKALLCFLALCCPGCCCWCLVHGVAAAQFHSTGDVLIQAPQHLGLVSLATINSTSKPSSAVLGALQRFAAQVSLRGMGNLVAAATWCA